MDFAVISKDISNNLDELVAYIVTLPIGPKERTRHLAQALRLSGDEFYQHAHALGAHIFDVTAMRPGGISDLDDRAGRLAQKIMRNYALSRPVAELVREYCESIAAHAQNELFENATSMQKHPTLTRHMRGETCDWCLARVGTHVNPSPDYFARHHHCDCAIEVSGYNSRNGTVNNFVKRR